jgi:hypothetical protein
MDVAEGIAFLGAELVLIALMLLALVRTGFARLESSTGILRDGLPVGKAAPSWSLPDITGQRRGSPAMNRWQFLIFTDHSLVAFPHLAAGMNHLGLTIPELEILMLSRDSRELCKATVQGLGLRIPLVPVDQAFYRRFRVRVMPFAFLLDPGGTIRWVGLVNTETQLTHVWQIIRATEDMGSAAKRAGA